MLEGGGAPKLNPPPVDEVGVGAGEGEGEAALMGGAVARAEVGALGAEKLKGEGLDEVVGGGVAVEAGFEKKLGTADLAGASVVLENLTASGVKVVVVEGPWGREAGAGDATGAGGVAGAVEADPPPPQPVAAFFSGSFFVSFSTSPLNLPSSTSSLLLFSSSPTAL